MIKRELNPEQGKRLNECLKKTHLTQKELAVKAGYTPQYVSNIIVGKKNMSLESAKAFAKELNVYPEYLLCESGTKNKEEYYGQLGKEYREKTAFIFDVLKRNGIEITGIELNGDTICADDAEHLPSIYPPDFLEILMRCNTTAIVTVMLNIDGCAEQCSLKDFNSLVEDIFSYQAFKCSLFKENSCFELRESAKQLKPSELTTKVHF